jgi:hypothetical protein
MADIYNEIDQFIEELAKSGCEEMSSSIKKAKASGAMATEILGLVLIELKKYENDLKIKNKDLFEKLKIIKVEISKILKL